MGSWKREIQQTIVKKKKINKQSIGTRGTDSNIEDFY